MLVYLDASNIFDDLKGRVSLSALRARSDITVVFSGAHFNDAGGGGVRGFEELIAYIGTWPNARFAAEPQRIPALELREFARARPLAPTATPQVIFASADSLGYLLDEIDGPAQVALTNMNELETQLAENEALKKGMAKAMTVAKRAAAIKPKVESSPAAEEAARELIEQMNALDQDALSMIREFVESDQEVPAPDVYDDPSHHELQRDMTSALRDFQRAALARDVPGVVEALAAQSRLLPRIERDPLLGPVVLAKRTESERWISFQTNCILHGASVVASLAPAEIDALYRQMVANPALCPAWTLLWNVEARMKRDAKTPMKSSDSVDLAHLMVLPYVDLIFVDTRIYNYVTTTKHISASERAKCRPTTAVAEWLSSL